MSVRDSRERDRDRIVIQRRPDYVGQFVDIYTFSHSGWRKVSVNCREQVQTIGFTNVFCTPREIVIEPFLGSDIVVHVYGVTRDGKRTSEAYHYGVRGLSRIEVNEREFTTEDGKRYRGLYATIDGVEFLLDKQYIGGVKNIHTIHVRKTDKGYEILGDTFVIRELLRANGYRWVPNERLWRGTKDPSEFLKDLPPNVIIKYTKQTQKSNFLTKVLKKTIF